MTYRQFAEKILAMPQEKQDLDMSVLLPKNKLTLEQLKTVLNELPAESLKMDALIYDKDRNVVYQIEDTFLAGELPNTGTMDAIFQLADEQPLLIV